MVFFLLIKGTIKKDVLISEDSLKLIFYFPFFVLTVITLCLIIMYHVNYLKDNLYGNVIPFYIFSWLGMINVTMNLFGIPLWLFWYMDLKNSMTFGKKIIVNVITQIRLILINGVILLLFVWFD